MGQNRARRLATSCSKARIRRPVNAPTVPRAYQASIHSHNGDNAARTAGEKNLLHICNFSLAPGTIDNPHTKRVRHGNHLATGDAVENALFGSV